VPMVAKLVVDAVVINSIPDLFCSK